MAEETKSKEEQYEEARAMHRSYDEKLRTLQEKAYLTADEELEIKLLKKWKLHYKDIMETLKAEIEKSN